MKLFSVLLMLVLSHKCYSQENNKMARFVNDTMNNRKLYLFVDKMPESSKEQPDLMRYIFENNFWPEMNRSCWFDKIVYEFVVEPNDQISNVNIQINGMVICDDSLQIATYVTEMKENLNRLLKKMKWKSGELKGTKVPVLLRFPLIVHLQFE